VPGEDRDHLQHLTRRIVARSEPCTAASPGTKCGTENRRSRVEYEEGNKPGNGYLGISVHMEAPNFMSFQQSLTPENS